MIITGIMNIYNNFMMILNLLASIINAPLNRILILACSTQVASMITKVIITSIRLKKVNLKNMFSYGGMPSSHTAFVSSLMFGFGLDKNYGWQHPLFTISMVFSAIVIADAIRLRGTIDKLNDTIALLVAKDKDLKNIRLPKHVAHSTAEVIGGIIFSFLYTFLFYLFFYDSFPR